jgi:hypothetical protein
MFNCLSLYSDSKVCVHVCRAVGDDDSVRCGL